MSFPEPQNLVFHWRYHKCAIICDHLGEMIRTFFTTEEFFDIAMNRLQNWKLLILLVSDYSQGVEQGPQAASVASSA
jgi:hypothetical protein